MVAYRSNILELKCTKDSVHYHIFEISFTLRVFGSWSQDPDFSYVYCCLFLVSRAWVKYSYQPGSVHLPALEYQKLVFHSLTATCSWVTESEIFFHLVLFREGNSKGWCRLVLYFEGLIGNSCCWDKDTTKSGRNFLGVRFSRFILSKKFKSG